METAGKKEAEKAKVLNKKACYTEESPEISTVPKISTKFFFFVMPINNNSLCCFMRFFVLHLLIVCVRACFCKNLEQIMTAGKVFYWWHKTKKKQCWVLRKKRCWDTHLSGTNKKTHVCRVEKKSIGRVCMFVDINSVDFNCHIVDFSSFASSLHKCLTAPKKNRHDWHCCCYTCQQVKNTFPKVLSPIKFAGNQAQSTKHFMWCSKYTSYRLQRGGVCVCGTVSMSACLRVIVCYYNRYGERIKLKYSDNSHCGCYIVLYPLCAQIGSYCVCRHFASARHEYCVGPADAARSKNPTQMNMNHARIPFR